jgi:hypothetical protein
MCDFPDLHCVNKNHICGSVSVAQLVATRDNLCRGRGSNPGFPPSPHIMYVNLATRLLDPKKKKHIRGDNPNNQSKTICYDPK